MQHTPLRNPGVDAEPIWLYGVCLVGQSSLIYDLTPFRWSTVAMMTLEPPCPTSLDEHRAHGMIDVILQGLAHMHECDFVHGDMKPENALLTPNSIVKLTDSGTSAA